MKKAFVGINGTAELKTLICVVIDRSEAVRLPISANRGLFFKSRLPMQALLFFKKTKEKFWSVFN